MKTEYELPITRPNKKSEGKKEKDMVEEEYDLEFEDADYIPAIF